MPFGTNMSRAARKSRDFAPDADEPAFPLVVVRVGGEGTLIPPPPSSRGRRRVPTWPGLGVSAAVAAPEHRSAEELDPVDELMALSEPVPDAFYYPPEDSS